MRPLGLLILLFVGLVTQAQADPIKLRYKMIDTVELELWVYQPKERNDENKNPCMLFFHGGGWTQGSPKSFHRQANYFVSRGLTVFSAEYRVKSIHGTTPFDATADAHDAFAYLVDHAVELGIDPNKIVVSGGSAGGHLALTTWFWNPNTIKPLAFVLFNPVMDTSKEGYGFRQMEGRFEEISPMEYITKNHPPTLVLVGTLDKVLPVGLVEKYRSKMEAVGADLKVVYYPDQEHSFYHRKPYFQDTLYESDLFLSELGIISGSPTIETDLNSDKK